MGKMVGHERRVISHGAKMCVITVVVIIRWEQRTVKDRREVEQMSYEEAGK